MDRIAPNGIAAWFKSHPEVRPLRSEFALIELVFEDDIAPDPTATGRVVSACCGGVAALLALEATGGDLPRHLWWLGDTDGRFPRVAQRLGLPIPYLLGFATGWDVPDLLPQDGWWRGAADRDAYLLGYQDGVAAANLCPSRLSPSECGWEDD